MRSLKSHKTKENSELNLLNTRSNDGRCDNYGRFIIGGYVEYKKYPKNIFKKISNVYRININGTYQKIISNISCSNSICFNKNKMFITDSRSYPKPKQIIQYKYYNNSIYISWNKYMVQ